ncbi:RNA polymerase sigma factor [Chitinophaga nivalis]|uniref:Sigma-70 family RNA polymerase sigma factor n=1 Tax=Chitinophaga nivalis TaxID=2991709 RepID=A0ABT3IJV2_9BACT|nr:sigma-70 family RNA polymerase sigma factor [Chitinophaga nivalis]MCW3466076.1 sigma-70 family RNA polymerase sigma factor [Chitinophaga nivalis]MCW3484233.1 sigma-70 family RNA polymerase sigma factor [Chitinophaga nivalis]
MTADQEMELFRQMKQDDVQAFNLLFRTYWERLYLFAYRKLNSEDDAKDIIQNIFISFWLKRNTLIIQSSVESYLFSIARYELLSFVSRAIKSREKQEILIHTILPAFEAPLTPMEAREIDQLLLQEEEKLPKRMKQIFKMAREENLSIREISVALQLSEQNVRNQLNTAITKVKVGLGEAVLAAILFSQLS